MYAFELERLEPEDDRLVLTGRWSGVRGLRFMRPTLIVDGRQVLATLEHKPWAPSEDRPWVAAFPWSGDPVDAETALLAVGPSITVPLAGGQAAPAPVREQERLAGALDDERVRGERLRHEVRFLRDRLDAAGRREGREDVHRREIEGLRAELAELARSRDEARRERDAAVQARDDALEARDGVLRDLEAARRAAQRAEDEARDARAEAAAAREERERADQRREEARRHREEALVASRTLERRLRHELAGTERPADGEEREQRFAHVPQDDDEPLGVRHVPATRSEARLVIPGPRVRDLTSLDVWVARALGGAAALCFLVLLVTLVVTLT